MWIDKRNVRNFKGAVFGFISSFPKSLKENYREIQSNFPHIFQNQIGFSILHLKKEKFQKSLNLIGQIMAPVMVEI